MHKSPVRNGELIRPPSLKMHILRQSLTVTSLPARLSLGVCLISSLWAPLLTTSWTSALVCQTLLCSTWHRVPSLFFFNTKQHLRPGQGSTLASGWSGEISSTLGLSIYSEEGTEFSTGVHQKQVKV